jgi:hypothetical protein
MAARAKFAQLLGGQRAARPALVVGRRRSWSPAPLAAGATAVAASSRWNRGARFAVRAAQRVYVGLSLALGDCHRPLPAASERVGGRRVPRASLRMRSELLRVLLLFSDRSVRSSAGFPPPD